MSATMNVPILSKRGQAYLLQLHRTLATTNRAVDRALTNLVAAIHACDSTTQHEFFAAYCTELRAHKRAIGQITLFVEHRFHADVANGEQVSDN